MPIFRTNPVAAAGPLRSRRKMLRDAFGLAGAMVIGSRTEATDYRPVRCSARAPYSGAPLHPPVDAVELTAIPDRPLPAATMALLDAAFARLKDYTAAPALSAAVACPGVGLWHRQSTQPERPILWWASVGKAFTATVVLQLVQEAKLSLDAPVSQWVEGVPNGHIVTVRDLLAHTSGLFSANEDMVVRAHPGYRDPATMLAIAGRHGAMFCPGERWRYSNTGYDVLGMIVERVDRRPLDAAITARIIEPLGLRSMRALSPGQQARDVALPASTQGQTMDPSWAGAAGPVVSDARDMALAWAALLDGHFLRKSLRQEMTATLYPMFDPGTYYGLGMMVFEVPDGPRTLRWIGHAGGAPGVNAIALYSPDDDAIVTVAMTGEGSATACANLILKALRP
ncbi:serine hydrolase domain-containing protein [Novosphingobium sp. KACC 22771]|uniref:serine hydrolase domain-containing protein n=1 Tax=Novosphingobium sp. KACC 22771 TaxID=3025670 RepID=UPI002365AFA3|nr:serine hydrolase domain-containing protein [Novosphingobium sp. KACC 22771]WDF74436.1 serine hydrolase [Novosphingobium sp. KACC 22771]